mmetsp:Transcript_6118/g.17118  ORF Transcript_6118/g.17118 Transcript_6118/m.17118 type:complete len:548 (-) Transcript_6118:315-1958(-)
MDAIPQKLAPMVRRLESLDDVSHDQLISIIFVVRLADELHRSFYGSFLTQSLVRQLTTELGIPDLSLEIEVFALRWDYRQGTISTCHRIAFDYDMADVHELSKIGWAVLDRSLPVQDGLRAIRDMGSRTAVRRVENCYRDFPGRAFIIPLMASTCATVYFNGTWLDLGFSAACGVASGLVAWIATMHEQLAGVCDYLAAIVTAMISTAAVTTFPDSACFSSQVLGTLYWFLYGTAFVISLYEISNNQLITGTTRFIQATLRSYGLAFGSLIGVWIAAYGGEGRWEAVEESCSVKEGQISNNLWYLLLFPGSAIACLMQFRVKLVHFPVCFIVQCVAYGFQYLLGTVWKQPEFLANLVPAFLATITSALCISITHRLKIYNLEVRREAYLLEKKKNDDDDKAGAQHSSRAPEEGIVETVALSGTTPGGGEQSARSHHDSNVIAFVSDRELYTKNDTSELLQYASSDLWFCLLPALYLLVPGSKLLQTAFEGLVSALDSNEGDGIGVNQIDSLAASLLVVALGQVIGLRLGFMFLWLCSASWSKLTRES